MLAMNPENALARYGLAMEYANSGEWESAIEEFRNLQQAKPDYVAAYFHGGQTLEKAGRTGEAREMYKQGIAVAERIGDSHTRAEIDAALSILGD